MAILWERQCFLTLLQPDSGYQVIRARASTSTATRTTKTSPTTDTLTTASSPSVTSVTSSAVGTASPTAASDSRSSTNTTALASDIGWWNWRSHHPKLRPPSLSGSSGGGERRKIRKPEHNFHRHFRLPRAPRCTFQEPVYLLFIARLRKSLKRLTGGGLQTT